MHSTPDPAAAPHPDPAAAPEREVVRTTQVVYSQHLNHHGTLFGGEALQMMDTTAFVAASRVTREMMVVVSVDHVRFEAPVRLGNIVEVEARVVEVGRTSVGVELQMFAEVPETGERHRSGYGKFVMVAVDEDGRPVEFTPHT